MSHHPAICACGDHVWAALTRGYVTLVSPQDQGLIFDKWHAFKNQAGNVYAARKSGGRRGKSKYLHRVILGAGPQIEVDHKNRNGLDNRRDNLRPATKRLNAANRKKKTGTSSRFKGVCHTKRNLKKPFVANIAIGNGKHRNLGYFTTEEEAAAAYMKAAREHFGEFARSA